MQSVSRGEICKCVVHGTLIPGEDGQLTSVGILFFARRTASGRVGLMFLLIDPLCTGVAEAGGRLLTQPQMEEIVESTPKEFSLVPIDPPSARKLVEGAIAYAAQFGIPPHPDYRKFEPLWGDVDPSESDLEFTYGVNGRPLYVPGSASEAEQRLIISRLAATVGIGNFDVEAEPSLPDLGLRPGDVVRRFVSGDLFGAGSADDESDDESDDEDPEEYRDK